MTRKLLIFLSLFFFSICLLDAINIVLTSGQKLDNLTWNELSGVLNKVKVNSNNLEFSGKLLVNGKICESSGKCLGDLGTFENPGETCLDLFNNGIKINGYYYIKPVGYEQDPFSVYCDMTTNGGGWTRYAYIKGSYPRGDALDCFEKNDGIVSTNTLECFNPNRYSIDVNDYMLKVGDEYFVKTLNTVASTSTITTVSNQSVYCLGNEKYFTIATQYTSPPTRDNVIRIWLGLNSCPNNTVEIGGTTTNGTTIENPIHRYANLARGGGFGKIGTHEEARGDIAENREFFIR